MAMMTLSTARAQAPSPPRVVCQCGAMAGPHYHLAPQAGGYPAQAERSSMRGGAIYPSDAGPIYGLPRGRRYYGGRYFGSFNNRFYGPQYGNF